MSNIPEKIQQPFDNILEFSIQILSKGEDVTPLAFIGTPSGSWTAILGDRFRFYADKQQFDGDIRQAVQVLGANIVITVMESWSLPDAMLNKFDEIVAKYGSIGNSPYKVDCLSILMETEECYWSGIANIKPYPPSKFKRKLGELKIIRGDEFTGLFRSYLPKTADTSKEYAPTSPLRLVLGDDELREMEEEHLTP